jgi:hypothetical protein
MKKILSIFIDRLTEIGNFLYSINYLKRIFPVLLVIFLLFAYLINWFNTEITHSKADLMQLLQQNKIFGEYDSIDSYEKLEFVDNSEIDSLTDFYNEDFRQHDNYICFYICDNYKNANNLKLYLQKDKKIFYVYKHRNIVFYTNSASTFNKFAAIIDNLI